MTPKPVTIAALMSAGAQRASQRWQLLAMLAILYGIVSSIINQPAFSIFEAFASATNTTANSDSSDYSRELAILKDGFPTLIWVYLATTALGALLLIPWSRAIAPGDLIPSQGDAKAHAIRLIRSFSHYITATLMTGVAIMLGGTIVTLLASSIGFLATPLVFAGVLSLVWVSIILNAIANYAVFFEAQDKPVSYADAWRKFRPALVPLSASLAVFYMASIIASFVVNGLFGPTGLNLQLPGMAINGAFSFGVGALHIAALAHYNSIGQSH